MELYNRYIPQQDGTYQKNRIPTPAQPSPVPPPCPPPQRDEEKTLIHHSEGAFSFLKQLIPNNLDTGDLMIIILLLLMSGDCKEQKNNWLLTLAFYLFL